MWTSRSYLSLDSLSPLVQQSIQDDVSGEVEFETKIQLTPSLAIGLMIIKSTCARVQKLVQLIGRKGARMVLAWR